LNFAGKASETDTPIGGVTGGVTAGFCGAQVIVSRFTFESSECNRFLFAIGLLVRAAIR
jgi:hypothetical protein